MSYSKQFHCTQRELYAICAHAWETCEQHLERFSSFKAKYKKAFVDARKEDIAKVGAMNDRYQRTGKQEHARQDLKEQVGLCLMAWRKLKSYIAEAWPEDKHEVCFKVAGQQYYRETYNLKWESCQSLMK